MQDPSCHLSTSGDMSYLSDLAVGQSLIPRGERASDSTRGNKGASSKAELKTYLLRFNQGRQAKGFLKPDWAQISRVRDEAEAVCGSSHRKALNSEPKALALIGALGLYLFGTPDRPWRTPYGIGFIAFEPFRSKLLQGDHAKAIKLFPAALACHYQRHGQRAKGRCSRYPPSYPPSMMDQGCWYPLINWCCMRLELLNGVHCATVIGLRAAIL
ncbi:hypothetical protein LIA77_03993 [Sarocladium implicatum]|nr:hypothetical protein LIA77_03993 [Sarocladium implicatum]